MDVWQDALGETLPPLGPPKQNLLAIAGAVVAGIAVVGVLAWQGYERFLTEAQGFQIGPERSALRDAGLEWRRLYAKDRPLAASLEIWASSDQGPFTLVTRTEPDDEPHGLKVRKRLLEAKHRWTPSLKQLQASKQSAVAGSERLPRGALLVSLDDHSTGERLVASKASPDGGYFQIRLPVRVYQSCVPDVGQALEGALLASPMTDDTESPNAYWTALDGRSATIVRVGQCAGEAPLLGDEQKVVDVPENSTPLLSLGPGSAPYVLFLENDAFALWSYDRESIERRQDIKPDTEVFDSFQRGVDDTSSKVSVPVRLRRNGEVEYLVKSDSGWKLEPCAAPNPDLYAALPSSSRACEGKVPAYVEIPFDKIERQRSRDVHPTVEPGEDRYVIKWDGLDRCYVDLKRSPCADKGAP